MITSIANNPVLYTAGLSVLPVIVARNAPVVAGAVVAGILAVSTSLGAIAMNDKLQKCLGHCNKHYTGVVHLFCYCNLRDRKSDYSSKDVMC